MAAIRLTRTHRILIGIVVAGAVVIAGIGFAGSYAAVRTLALHKGFGWFANVFPIGVDAGIVVLLALDLLLTWLRIPFPLLRQTAWLLTAATIAFNGAAAWPDPLGVGMHAIIPVLFVVAVEAARHAIGRVADITADKHMESVRITRWILAPVPTFRLWRRMKLWELRSYEEVIRREQDRLVYRARLRARYGVAWRRRAPIEAIMPLRLARYGVPLAETADAGLEAAGIEVASTTAKQLPAAAAPEPTPQHQPQSQSQSQSRQSPPQARQLPTPGVTGPTDRPEPGWVPEHEQAGQYAEGPYGQPYDPRYDAGFDPRYDPRYDPRFDPRFDPRYDPRFDPQYAQYAQYDAQYDAQAYEAAAAANAEWNGQPTESPWFDPPQFPQGEGESGPQPQAEGGPEASAQEQLAQQGQQVAPPVAEAEAVPQVMVPAGPNRSRPLSGAQLNGTTSQQQPAPDAEPELPPTPEPAQTIAAELETYPVGGLQFPEDMSVEDAYYAAYRGAMEQVGDWPNARHLARSLSSLFPGTPPEEREVVQAIRALRYRYTSEANAETIP